MQEVAISEFKAKCLAIMKRVNKTRKPIRVTRFGKPIAEIVPPSSAAESRRNWMGSLAQFTKITGDIVSPIIALDDIEAMRK